MRTVGADDPSGVAAIRALVEEVTGCAAGLTFAGALRNVVSSPRDGYECPTPNAYFGVWASPSGPRVDGERPAVGGKSKLRGAVSLVAPEGELGRAWGSSRFVR